MGYHHIVYIIHTAQWIYCKNHSSLLGGFTPIIPFLGLNINKNSSIIVTYFIIAHMAVCQNLVPLVNIKIAGKWMFIPLKMALIGIDPYPYEKKHDPF